MAALQQIERDDQATFEGTLLLPGEDAGGAHPDDAEHWILVYEELISFLHRARPDLPATLERYQLRLAYWRRLREHAEARR